MIDVTAQNFEAEVLVASMSVPVLVDFWAPWCGPCKVIGPLLEKLEVAYQGRFRLVKINSDQEQQLSAAFGIRSIPTCILLMGGKPVDGFMGALPEGQIRAFLDKHLPSDEELEALAGAEDAQALLAAGDTQAALNKLHEALSIDPANDDARYDYVRLLLEQGLFDEAEAALAPALARVPRPLRFEALQQYLASACFVHTAPHEQTDLARLDSRIAANRRDFDARLAKARVLLMQGEAVAAMEELLEIVMRDKTWNDAVARKTYVAILELLTPPKPKAEAQTGTRSAGGIELAGKTAATLDPQEQLVSTYRRKLSMALN